jgi:spore photoproduct lyase
VPDIPEHGRTQNAFCHGGTYCSPSGDPLDSFLTQSEGSLSLILKKLFIERAAVDYPETIFVRKRVGLPTEIVEDERAVFEYVASASDPVQRGKETLFLTRNQGAFVRKCPGTSYYTCCDYQILHVGTFCTMDCAYCILQAYFHPPVLQYFVNHDILLQELRTVFSHQAIHRIGTGEFTDSLIWQSWTDLNEKLVTTFASQTTAVLELKTKAVCVDGLKHLKHNRKTIMAWSLNTPRVIKNEERQTSSLHARLKAAARCESWGYPLAFHFDPMVIYEGCEEEYRQVVKTLFSTVSADNIVWISIGSFRFMPQLKPMIEKRFPASNMVYGEFITGMDGKMRYFKPLRIALYQQIIADIRSLAPNVTLYFCMEDDEVWQQSLGFIPEQPDGVGRMLDESALRHCDLQWEL